MSHKFTKGQKVIDSISGQECVIHCEDKSEAYYVDMPGVEWVLWRGEDDLKEVSEKVKVKKTKKIKE